MIPPDSLWYCVRKLGLVTGWRYWRLHRRSVQDPEVFLVWADRWYEAAVYVEEAGFLVEAGLLREWADEAVRKHVEYHKQNERQSRSTTEAEGELGPDNSSENHTGRIQSREGNLPPDATGDGV